MTTATRRRPHQVAAGIHYLSTGPWRLASNVYFVESGNSWALIDTGWPGHAARIRSAAESLFGRGTRPAAILLSHIHPDHSGSAENLARYWDLPVLVHPAEVPQARGGILPGYASPLDRFVIGPLLRLLPPRSTKRADPLADVVQQFDPDGPVHGLPGWRCIPAPGHTPGSIVYFRPSDRVMISGDALCTVDLNSVRGFVLGRPTLGGPPWVSTWNWSRARGSVARLAELEPTVVAGGHGCPMTGVAPVLRDLPSRMHRRLR